MKNSLSSIQSLLHLLVICVFIIIVTSSATVPETSAITNHPNRRHRLHDHNSCTTISNKRRPSPLCKSRCPPPLPPLRHQHPQPPPGPPPPPLNEEIDPRYGVSKRLVPSGPNPLHN
ncbi:hypothetical protein L2E82_08718 [Cichorium intybus]|uniref:Uncharacterized protein n=1 Tax=Cichorium intybus TaxID=13427 RepID=A0ACB9G6M0_CICIN|nr:hypothetical protein L2E82_08718 [Cichorium intybus]